MIPFECVPLETRKPILHCFLKSAHLPVNTETILIATDYLNLFQQSREAYDFTHLLQSQNQKNKKKHNSVIVDDLSIWEYVRKFPWVATTITFLAKIILLGDIHRRNNAFSGKELKKEIKTIAENHNENQISEEKKLEKKKSKEIIVGDEIISEKSKKVRPSVRFDETTEKITIVSLLGTDETLVEKCDISKSHVMTEKTMRRCRYVDRCCDENFWKDTNLLYHHCETKSIPGQNTYMSAREYDDQHILCYLNKTFRCGHELSISQKQQQQTSPKNSFDDNSHPQTQTHHTLIPITKKVHHNRSSQQNYIYTLPCKQVQSTCTKVDVYTGMLNALPYFEPVETMRKVMVDEKWISHHDKSSVGHSDIQVPQSTCFVSIFQHTLVQPQIKLANKTTNNVWGTQKESQEKRNSIFGVNVESCPLSEDLFCTDEYAFSNHGQKQNNVRLIETSTKSGFGNVDVSMVPHKGFRDLTQKTIAKMHFDESMEYFYIGPPTNQLQYIISLPYYVANFDQWVMIETDLRYIHTFGVALFEAQVSEQMMSASLSNKNGNNQTHRHKVESQLYIINPIFEKLIEPPTTQYAQCLQQLVSDRFCDSVNWLLRFASNEKVRWHLYDPKWISSNSDRNIMMSFVIPALYRSLINDTLLQSVVCSQLLEPFLSTEAAMSTLRQVLMGTPEKFFEFALGWPTLRATCIMLLICVRTRLSSFFVTGDCRCGIQPSDISQKIISQSLTKGTYDLTSQELYGFNAKNEKSNDDCMFDIHKLVNKDVNGCQEQKLKMALDQLMHDTIEDTEVMRGVSRMESSDLWDNYIQRIRDTFESENENDKKDQRHDNNDDAQTQNNTMSVFEDGIVLIGSKVLMDFDNYKFPNTHTTLTQECNPLLMSDCNNGEKEQKKIFDLANWKENLKYIFQRATDGFLLSEMFHPEDKDELSSPENNNNNDPTEDHGIELKFREMCFPLVNDALIKWCATELLPKYDRIVGDGDFEKEFSRDRIHGLLKSGVDQYAVSLILYGTVVNGILKKVPAFIAFRFWETLSIFWSHRSSTNPSIVNSNPLSPKSIPFLDALLGIQILSDKWTCFDVIYHILTFPGSDEKWPALQWFVRSSISTLCIFLFECHMKSILMHSQRLSQTMNFMNHIPRPLSRANNFFTYEQMIYNPFMQFLKQELTKRANYGKKEGETDELFRVEPKVRDLNDLLGNNNDNNDDDVNEKNKNPEKEKAIMIVGEEKERGSREKTRLRSIYPRCSRSGIGAMIYYAYRQAVKNGYIDSSTITKNDILIESETRDELSSAFSKSDIVIERMMLISPNHTLAKLMNSFSQTIKRVRCGSLHFYSSHRKFDSEQKSKRNDLGEEPSFSFSYQHKKGFSPQNKIQMSRHLNILDSEKNDIVAIMPEITIEMMFSDSRIATNLYCVGSYNHNRTIYIDYYNSYSHDFYDNDGKNKANAKYTNDFIEIPIWLCSLIGTNQLIFRCLPNDIMRKWPNAIELDQKTQLLKPNISLLPIEFIRCLVFYNLWIKSE